MSRIRKDAGWSWLVSFGLFVAYFLETGLVTSLGVLLPELHEQFSTETWIIGLAISSVPGFGAVACIISSAMTKLYSNRSIVVLCGSLASMGVIFGSMATTVSMLAMGLVVTGTYSGAQLVAFATLPRYFDKYFDVANSIAHAGLACGVFVMPLTTQFLLDVYGWRGAMLILGGITAHVVVTGASLRPVTEETQKECPSSDQKHTQKAKPASLIANVIAAFDLDLFLNIDFVSLACINFASGYYFTGWLIYLVPHAEDLGFSPYASSALATFGGIGNLIGSCIFPLLTKVLSSKLIIILANILVFISLAVDPIISALHSYVGLALRQIWKLYCFVPGSKYNTTTLIDSIGIKYADVENQQPQEWTSIHSSSDYKANKRTYIVDHSLMFQDAEFSYTKEDTI
ncbi:monocarboxylate transporter 11-like [Amphiura filiformis]|uniref:monocarboxylate transporter 11-like n=1 Tax=Amphiura filiformis TaxID=82378 RepID=UPI003B213805